MLGRLPLLAARLALAIAAEVVAAVAAVIEALAAALESMYHSGSSFGKSKYNLLAAFSVVCLGYSFSLANLSVFSGK